MKRVVWCLLTTLVLAGCASTDDPVRVGAKGFAESEILAEAVAALLEAQDVPAEVVSCGDTWTCRSALSTGEIDVMVEYTGTALRFAGLDPHVANAPEVIDEAYASLGTSWVASLGFDNAYRLYVAPERARQLGSPTVTALADSGPIVFAAPPPFLRRPGDGMGALVTRYGMTLATEPLLISDPMDRYRTLLEGRADAVVGYATDGALLGLDLVELRDDLGFFPPYEAGLMARTAAPLPPNAVAEIGAALAAHVDRDVMQRLNFAAEVEGRGAGIIAIEFLRSQELLEVPEPVGAALRIAVPEDGAFEAFESEVIGAVRAAFDGRAVELVRTPDPFEGVLRGEERLALVGAAHFFGDEGRDDRLEAAVVVGERLAHAVVRTGSAGLSGRVGLPLETDRLSVVADTLVGGRTPELRGEASELLAALATGSLDGTLLFAPLGDNAVRDALAAGGLEVVPVRVPATPNAARATPFLVDARIAGGTYPGQPRAVETVGAQVLLAAVSRGFAAAAAAGGPATALPATGTPLSRDQVDRLASAVGSLEAPHPALPSAWTPPPAPIDSPVFSKARALDTALNVFAICFLLFVVAQVARREPKHSA